MTEAPHPRYRIIGPLNDGPGRRSFRARNEETGDEVMLHTWPRASLPRALIAAAQDQLSCCIAPDYPQILRTRALRVDAENVVLETDFVPGETLDRALVRDLRFAPRRALAIAEDVLDALVALHTAGLPCGTLRPSTVWIGRDGRARLLGAGVSPILAPMLAGSDCYSGAALRSDAFAATAVLFHMIVGEPPPTGPWPAWPAASINRIFEAVSAGAPETRPDAPTLLAMVRAAREEAERSEESAASAPSLLDPVAEPAPLERSWRERARDVARSNARRVLEFMTGSAWPTLAAAGAAALLALLMAGPFLGREAWWPEATRSAQPLPPGLPLPPPESVSPAAGPERTAAVPATPRERTSWDLLREEAAALAEIGAFEEALVLLAKAEAPPEQLREERDAVIARADKLLQETAEATRRLAAADHIEQAQREWELLEPFWPTAELRDLAKKHQEALKAVIREVAERRANVERRREEKTAEAQLLRLLVQCLSDEDGTFAERMARAETFSRDLESRKLLSAAEEARALTRILGAEQALARAAQHEIDRSLRRPRISDISRRFGEGEIVALADDALTVSRGGDQTEKIPLRRLSGRERLALFRALADLEGNHAIARAVLCIRTGLYDEARAEMAGAPASVETTIQIRVLKRVLEEVQK